MLGIAQVANGLYSFTDTIVSSSVFSSEIAKCMKLTWQYGAYSTIKEAQTTYRPVCNYQPSGSYICLRCNKLADSFFCYFKLSSYRKLSIIW